MTSGTGQTRVGAARVAIMGVGCRLPGAADPGAFWRLLDEGRCTVRDLPDGRWQAGRYLHPRRSEPGTSYSFAGGYIDDPLGFDPIVFGISPREAAEMDPQQRLLLEVVWSAIEDCGIPPSAMAGAEIGVYVGASSLDYGNLYTADPAAIESHFMTGNTLSVLANRISYIFDLRGPSFTVDTACSSSLVAFAEAQAAIASGRIDMAIVAGVNLLLSPTAFIGFSRASMLSPTGLCRPFSADADGYVRAEGAVAMVLARLETAVARHYPVRAVALASGVNSDGRTNGIALPSAEGQRALLDRVYRDIDPARLAFVEAHGTGTRVGDPAEAAAIGGALGTGRTHPLPIGSVKSNIGHLEPASGLAGLLKAILALEHRRLPASLHLDTVNPGIDFAALNLAIAHDAVTLPAQGTWLAGVSSFGFGGTNAHVVIRQPEAVELPPPPRGTPARPAELLVLSAHSRPALTATAANYADLLAAGADPAPLAAALGWQRDLAGHRLALPLGGADLAAALHGFAEGGNIAGGAAGVAPSAAPKLCFVFSGNGCQWAGMGRDAYARNPAFRAHFDRIDAIFSAMANWSLTAALDDEELDARLKQTRIAQPLLFAVQSALTASLATWGIRPDLVLGHSVGEVAAAEAAGALGLAEAVHVIHQRSEHQEAMAGRGGMAVVSLGPAAAAALLAESGEAGVEIAAVNSPHAVTVAGPADAITALSRFARTRRVATRVLDLAYPFHSALLEDLRLPLLAALGDFAVAAGDIPFVSTVTGGVLAGERLDSAYWWRNVRETVRFRDGVAAAARLGAGVFLEIGPRPILASNITDTLREAGADGTVLPTLEEKPHSADPVALMAARALAAGCTLDGARAFGSPPATRVALPPYAWQRKPFQQPHTTEAIDLFGEAPRHPLIGARLAPGTPEWRNLLDPAVLPYLADHRIDGEVVVPGAAFAEMALAVARDLFPEGPVGLEDFDLLQWLPLPPDAMRELAVRLNADTQMVEILSRPRLGAEEWTLHARGRITQVTSPPPAPVPQDTLPHSMTAAQIYGRAAAAGVAYGPAFRRVLHATRSDERIDAALSPVAAADGPAGSILHPIALDAAFHALFDRIKPRLGERYAYLPVRFAALRVDQDGVTPVRAVVAVDRETSQSISVSVALFDAAGGFVAGLSGGLFRAVVLDRRAAPNTLFRQVHVRLSRAAAPQDGTRQALAALAAHPAAPRPDAWLYLEAFTRSLAHAALLDRFGTAPIDPALPGMPHDARPLAQTLLEQLRTAGLASQTPSGWTLEAAGGLPPPAQILSTFAAECPAAVPEIVLAAQALAGLGPFLAAGAPLTIRPAIAAQFEASGLLFAPVLTAAVTICTALRARIAPEPLRVLVAEPACLGVLHILSPLVQDGRISLTVVGANLKRLHQTAARHGAAEAISFAAIDAAGDSARFDAAFAMAFGPAFDGDPALGRAIARLLAPGAPLCLLQPPESPALDLLLGASAGWFTDPARPLGRAAAGQDNQRTLTESGFGGAERHALADGGGSLVLALAPASDAGAPPAPLTLAAGASPLVPALAASHRMAGGSVRILDCNLGGSSQAWQDAAGDLVFVADGPLAGSMATLGTLLDAVGATPARLWLVVRGLDSSDPATLDPAAEALWGFARVAVNEYPTLDLRLVDVAPELEPETAAARLAALIAAPPAETELLIDRLGLSAVRTLPGLPASGRPVPAARLQLRSKAVPVSFDWAESARRAPGPAEIEVAIAAAGLNFRDVMLATGLLDDDVLDDGLAGAVFGLECAGQVVRAGRDVTGLAVGDAVMGFGRESFASHSTADARLFAPVPDGMAVEAAATIPVAFLTAWYALVHLAQIQPGEWVLIHGAAGGVGLAAIQIARLRGARVAATVSTADKRALVTLFGAERVYNSRSTAFQDAIAQDIGGVDAVLNSLAGNAMKASVKCLKPFGRFVELGKRDYVLNTALGLRPFRRNLTYFGVDLDQLLAGNLPLAAQLMAELAAHFTSGALAPLPYRAFPWSDAGRAFAEMQAASHVGKLIVTPAAHPVATVQPPARFEAGAGAHLVVGGGGGFGFEAAAWLASRGARTIVIACRSGRIAAALEPRAAAIRAAGTTLLTERLDVTSAAAVAALTARLVATHGRLAGVIHAAAVLDDGLIANRTAARQAAVLAPKIAGIDNLDAATRDRTLDYFVAFSSATVLIGNPGQADYVAANGYMQGVMRRRRAAGLPGLAVGWGAIADAGMLARDGAVAAKLAQLGGIVALPALDALAALDTLLVHPPAGAVVYSALFRPGAALQSLKLLRTPALALLAAGAEGAPTDAPVDLALQIAGKSDGEARSLVAGLVAAEVARIFRLAPEEIEPGRPLNELGMDSMMSLDLRMGIEGRFGIALPIVAISPGISVNDLASRLIAGLRALPGDPAAGEAELRLLQQHGGGSADLDALLALSAAVEARGEAAVPS